MQLNLSKAALKGLSRMPPKARTALMDKLTMVAAAPFAHHAFDVKAMRGIKDVFRIRQGDWRAIYEIVRTEDMVLVIVVDVRGEVYE